MARRLGYFAASAMVGSVAIAACGLAAKAQGVLDQANEPVWSGAAVSISPKNEASQSFTPKFERLTGIEVALMTVGRGQGGDDVTLTLEGGAASQPLASSRAAIPRWLRGLLAVLPSRRRRRSRPASL